MKSMSGRGGLGRGALTSLVSLLIVLLAVEAVSRRFLPPPRELLEPQMVAEYSPTLKWTLKPNQNAFTIDAPVSTNSHGFRGSEVAVPKPPRVFRIVLLGDSITFGLGTRLEAMYATKLQAALDARHGTGRFEIINMGVPGYNTRQELIALKAKGLEFEPDLAVVEFYWNDIIDNDRPLPWEPGFVPEPFAVFEEAAYARRLFRYFFPDSVRQAMRRWRTLHVAAEGAEALKEMLMPSEHPYRTHFRALLEGNDEYLNHSWVGTEKRLRELAELGDQHHVRVALVIFPDAIQMDPRYREIRYQPEVKKICARLAVPCLDLLPAFRRAHEASRSPFRRGDNAHPNEVGQAIAGEGVVEFLLSHGLVPVDAG